MDPLLVLLSTQGEAWWAAPAQGADRKPQVGVCVWGGRSSPDLCVSRRMVSPL